MAKYYFRDKDDDRCYGIEAHLNYMQENNINKMEVFEAEREIKTDWFYCKFHQGIGTVGESCGKNECENYKPNNGKNGRCKYYGYVYTPTNKTRLLELELL